MLVGRVGLGAMALGVPLERFSPTVVLLVAARCWRFQFLGRGGLAGLKAHAGEFRRETGL